MDRFRDRIFKGATRPAMMLGIPIVPFILIVGFHLILIVWTFILSSPFVSIGIGFILIMVLLFLRQLNSSDNHRISQYFLYAKDFGNRRNKKYWGAHSMSPIKFKKR